MNRKIAFVGLGNMGLPMALNLQKAGVDLACFDIDENARARATAAGLPLAESLAAALVGRDAVVSMLPAGAQSRAAHLDSDGILSDPNRAVDLLIDCTTAEVECAQEIARAAAARGIDFVDAPVSGGVGGARAGTLSFLVGATDSAFARAQPILAAMGANVFHAGENGAGQAAKICNNMLLSILMIGTCEALALGEKNGLSAARLSEIMRKSSGGNWALEKYNPWPGVMAGSPAGSDYEGGFAVDLMVKDSDLAMAMAARCDAKTPLGEAANRIYRAHQKSGNGRLDFGSVLRPLRGD